MDMHSTEYAHSMARGLGWFSIGLGLAEVLAPRTLTRGLGMEGNEQLVQACGPVSYTHLTLPTIYSV